MADPKIKYDIEAAVSGEANVQQLENTLRDLGQVLEGDLKKQAVGAADALKNLTDKQQAVSAFRELRTETQQLGQALNNATGNLDKTAKAYDQAQAATQGYTQTQDKARAAVDQAKAELAEMRAALAALRSEYTGADRSTDSYRESNAQLRTTIADLRTTLKERRDELASSTTAAKSAQQAERALGAEYEREQTVARKLSADLGDKNRALEASRTTLQQAGIATTGLAETEKRLQASIRAVTEEVRTQAPAFQKAATESTAGLEKVKEGGVNAAAVLRTIGPLIGTAFSAQQFVEVIATQESLNRGFEQIFGSAARAGQEMEFIRATANKLGLENQTLAKSYQSLAASTKGTALEGQATRDVFEAVSRAMSTLGKSSVETDRALTAIAQIASKGTASMEELRGQLGEALPGALKAAADGAGITTEQLVSLVSQGKVLATDILPALTAGLNKLYGGAAPPDTIISNWARLKNVITETSVALGESGLSAAAAKTLSALAIGTRAEVQSVDLLTTALADLRNVVHGGTADFSASGTAYQKLRDGFLDAAVQAGFLSKATRELIGAQKDGANAAQEQFRKLELAAQKTAQVGEPILALKVRYNELTTSAEKYTALVDKQTAAQQAESAVLTQLVGLYGTEAEKRQAAGDAAEKQAQSAKRQADAREAEATFAELLLHRLQDEARLRNDTTEATKKEIAAAELNATTKRAESDQSAATARSKALETEAIKAASEAYLDNSNRVFELRGALEAANVELQRTITLQQQGKATDEDVSQARTKVAKATLLYRDALRDATDAAERKIVSDRQAAQVAQGAISVETARVQALQEVAAANGDAAKAAQLGAEATGLQVKAAQQAAAAAREEAAAIREAADTKERELQATGELTSAKKAEIDAQRASADLKDQEAQKADILAAKTRALAQAEQQRTSVLEQQITAEEKRLDLLERQDALERKRLGIDKEGFSADSSGNRIVAGTDLGTLTGIVAFLKAAGVNDDAAARRIALQFADKSGNITGKDSNAVEQYGGRGASISQALLAAAQKYTFDPRNAGTSTVPQQAARNVNFNLSINGVSYGTVPTTDQGQATLDAFLNALQSSKRAAGVA